MKNLLALILVASVFFGVHRFRKDTRPFPVRFREIEVQYKNEIREREELIREIRSEIRKIHEVLVEDGAIEKDFKKEALQASF